MIGPIKLGNIDIAERPLAFSNTFCPVTMYLNKMGENGPAVPIKGS